MGAESARLGPENSLRSTLNAKEPTARPVPHLHCPGGLLGPCTLPGSHVGDGRQGHCPSTPTAAGSKRAEHPNQPGRHDKQLA